MRWSEISVCSHTFTCTQGADTSIHCCYFTPKPIQIQYFSYSCLMAEQHISYLQKGVTVHCRNSSHRLQKREYSSWTVDKRKTAVQIAPHSCLVRVITIVLFHQGKEHFLDVFNCNRTRISGCACILQRISRKRVNVFHRYDILK